MKTIPACLIISILLVDGTCFHLALFGIGSHNYACSQYKEFVCALWHCAVLINKVVKGHLFWHNHSPKGESTSVFRTYKWLQHTKCIWTQLSLKWGIFFMMCIYTFDATENDLFICSDSAFFLDLSPHV